METPKIVVFVVKRYAVREAEKWRYAVRKAKIGRYAVRKGGGGCHPQKCMLLLQTLVTFGFLSVLQLIISTRNMYNPENVRSIC